MTNSRLLNFILSGMFSTIAALGQGAASSTSAACFVSGPEAVIERLADPRAPIKCRLEAVSILRNQMDERSIDALARSMDFTTEVPISKPEGFARYGGRNKFLGVYPAAQAIESMAKENPELVTKRLRAALRDAELSLIAIRNGAMALYLIHLDDPSQAIRALKEEATATLSADRRSALLEAAKFWSERCPIEKRDACKSTLL